MANGFAQRFSSELKSRIQKEHTDNPLLRQSGGGRRGKDDDNKDKDNKDAYNRKDKKKKKV